VEGAVIGGAALLLGGLATAGLMLWQATQKAGSRLWAISNRMEGWLYGIGGVLAALIGAVILFDQLG